MSSANSPVTVIGVGNAWAGDDAAGVLVARMVRDRAPDGVAVIEHEGEPTALLDAWEGARLAIELARALERAADQVLALAAVPG